MSPKKGGERFCKDKRTHSNLNALHLIESFKKHEEKVTELKRKRNS